MQPTFSANIHSVSKLLSFLPKRQTAHEFVYSVKIRQFEKNAHWRHQWWEQSTDVKSHIHLTCTDAPTLPLTVQSVQQHGRVPLTPFKTIMQKKQISRRGICSKCMHTIQKHFTTTVIYTTFIKLTSLKLCEKYFCHEITLYSYEIFSYSHTLFMKWICWSTEQRCT